MQYYRKAEESVKTILDAFETGKVPKALAQVFIKRNDVSPCRSWSWRNQLLVALASFSDARGFRQWKDTGRHVRKGEHCRCQILIPVTIMVEGADSDIGEQTEDVRIIGFTSAPVFGLEQTEGKPVEVDHEAENWLRSLPLRTLAESWGLNVESYNGHENAAFGWYRPGQTIAVGVKNLSTWAHELCHAADDRLGELRNGSRPDREIVAELAGATLLECLGHGTDADRGGAWEYIQYWAKAGKIHPLTACNRLLERACKVVDQILSEAAALELVAA